MATFYGADAQKYLNSQTTGGNENFTRQAPDLIVIKDTITIPAGLATGDIVFLGRELPGGRTIIPALSAVHVVTDPGTTLTLDIGINGVVDNIADGVECSIVGVRQPLEREVESVAGTRIIATVATATALTAGAIIDIYIVCRQTS